MPVIKYGAAFAIAFYLGRHAAFFLYVNVMSGGMVGEGNQTFYNLLFWVFFIILTGLCLKVFQILERAFTVQHGPIIDGYEARYAEGLRTIIAGVLVLGIATFGQTPIIKATGWDGDTAFWAAIVTGIVGGTLAYRVLKRLFGTQVTRIPMPFPRGPGQGGNADFDRPVVDLPASPPASLPGPDRNPVMANDSSGGIYLGDTLPEDTGRPQPYYYHDDTGLLTIASAGSGKNRSVVLNALMEYPGSLICLDPKGENAAVTAHRRGRGGGRVDEEEALGQDVYVADPFNIVSGHSSAAFSFLLELDTENLDIDEDIETVADAIVVPSGLDSFWDDCARQVLKGLIAWVLEEPEETRTLLKVRELAVMEKQALIHRLNERNTVGDLARKAAKQIGVEREGEHHLSGVRKNTQWLDSKAMKKSLETSDFRLRDLLERPTTIYLCLPPRALEIHKRWLRLFVALAIQRIQSIEDRQTRHLDHQILFLLDEFHVLGHMKTIETAAALMRGYGLKLWPILQNLGQLKRDYRTNWETFIQNAGAVQFFGINDKETAEYVSALCGKRIHEEENWKPSVSESLNNDIRGLGNRETGFTINQSYSLEKRERVVDLLNPREVRQFTSKESRRQLVFLSGGRVLKLNRVHYDERFDKYLHYDPNPYVKDS